MKTDLMFGDCTSILKSFSNESIDLILTDIPYGISFLSKRQNRSGHSGYDIKTERKNYFDKINGDEETPLEWLKEAFRVLKNDSALYVFIHWSKWEVLKLAVLDAGFCVKNMIVMNKSNWGMGDLIGNYAPKHELVLYATKGRHILNRANGRKSTVFDVPIKFSGAHRLHPNKKPVSWLEPFILESSQTGDTVLDPFMGSGSTGIACKNTGRNFIGIDNDEKYFNIAKERISNES